MGRHDDAPLLSERWLLGRTAAVAVIRCLSRASPRHLRMSIGHFQAIVKIDSVAPSDSLRILAVPNGMSLICET
jgi:hypothetical protein